MDYKEKLRLAKEALDSGSYDKETIEYIFPELKESEDEKIRKDIISLVKETSVSKRFYDLKKMLAWLEKQKSVGWSKEDEQGIADALWCCDKVASIAKNDNEMGKCFYAAQWLKSLTPQSHWKPTDYQIALLEELARNIRNNIRPFCSEVTSLEGLTEQLKTL